MGFFLSCVCYAFVCVCLYVPCGHLLGGGGGGGDLLERPTCVISIVDIIK